MNIGVYQGAASLAALERWQEAVSQNIAASSVPGFKKSEVSFASVLAETMRVGAGENFAAELRGVMPAEVSRINTEPGELRTTGNDLDFAIQGAGFFQIQRPTGDIGYTRDGEFHLSADRTLVTKQGYPVLGDGGPITFRPEGGRISINTDGAIVQGETTIGKLAVHELPKDAGLRRIGDGLMAPLPNVQPSAIERPAVLSGSLESSNVAPLREMVKLIHLSRAYEAAQRVIIAHDQNADKAIQALGNVGS
jgi:flagellar basal body rod protein FlgG